MENRGIKGFWVGDWLVEPALSRISRGDDRQHIEPRSMAVLECLVAHRGEVLSKERLIDAVWGEVFVSDEVLSHAIWDLRKSFGDDARNPSYIQTITKRGYRLIAEIRPMVERERRPSRPSRGARVAVGVAMIPVVALLALWLLGPGERPDERSAPVSLTPTLAVTLSGETSDASRPALETVLSDLGAISSFEVVEGNPPRPYPYSARDHGLELRGESLGRPGIARFRIYALATGATIWAGTATYGSAAPSGDRLAERIRLFGEINASDLYHDPHLEPWIDLKRHDWRAVLHFLRDAQRTYDFEVSDGADYLAAIRLDDGFLAPLTWWASCPRELPDECRPRLEALRDGVDNFDSAVAQFRLHALDGNLLMARRSLQEALESAPGNGPIRVNLAAVERFIGEDGARRALAVLTPLVEESWRYPSVYPQAASYALELGQFERARQILLRGVEFKPDVIDTLVLLEALALLEGDAPQADTWRERYLARIQVLTPEEKAPLVHWAYQAILDQAEARGATGIAETLRSRMIELGVKTD